ncbi:RHS repeat protein [Ahniella affigens]|uniref:RHS repeat protein n=1 Tax=Ahniella affigens TaxID=2021234 RepID=UPI00197FA9EC|nr:RHS repeat protein [Ahniella affigens]
MPRSSQWGMSACISVNINEKNRRLCQAAGGSWVVPPSGNPSCVGLPAGLFMGVGAWTNDISEQQLNAFGGIDPGCATIAVTAGADPGCGTVGQTWESGYLTLDKKIKNVSYMRKDENGCNPGVAVNENFMVGYSATLNCPLDAAAYPIVGTGKIMCGDITGDVCDVANPVDPASGEKRHSETTLAGLSMSDLLQVYYRSYGQWGPAGAEGILGNYWRFAFDRRVRNYDANAIIVHIAGSEPIMLRKNTSGVYTAINVTKTFGRTVVINASGFLLTDLDQSQWQFGLDGRLMSIEYADGRTVNVAWGTNTVALTDQSGRSVLIDSEDVQQDFGPVHNVTVGKRFEIADQSGQTVVVDTRQPGIVVGITTAAGTRQFLYEDAAFPSGLTGIKDELGVQHRRYTYVNNRVSEEFIRVGGTDIRQFAFSYSYSGVPTGQRNVTITNALNQSSTANIRVSGNVRRLYTQTDNCASCGSNTMSNSYNGDGTLAATIDLRGVRTEYTWDSARALETQRIEAKSAPGVTNPTVKRTIQTDWHPTFRLPIKKRRYNNLNVLEQIKSWAYNDRGQVTAECTHDPAVSGASTYACGSAANASLGVRQTTYAYLCTGPGSNDPNTCPIKGQLATIDGPRTDVADITTMAYYQSDDPNCALSATACAYRRGDLHTVTNALGHVTEYVKYDLAGRLARVRDPNGVLTDYAYDTLGRIQDTTVRANADGTPSADDITTSVTYESFGAVKRNTQPDGSYLEYSYDSAHRLVGVSDNLGNQITYVLDAAGNRTLEQTKDPQGNVKRLLAAQFDGFSRLKAQINAPYAGMPNLDDPAVKKTSNIYDMNGNLDLLIDPLGRVTDHDYDELNRLKKVVEDKATGGINATTQYEYDTRDNTRKVIDPKSLQTIYTYNGLDDLTQLQSPDTGTTLYTHDQAGNVLTQTDARGKVTTNTYDALGRLATRSYLDTSLNEVYSYDMAPSGCTNGYQIGRLGFVTDQSGSTAYCYDRQGRIVSKVQITTGGANQVVYTYTKSDQIETVTYPSGRSIRYQRDSLGRVAVVHMQETPLSVESVLIADVAYLPFGPVSQITWGTGVTQTRTYDQNYWIDEIASSAPTGLQANYELDDLGNIAAIIAGTTNRGYTYDALYRLTGQQENGSNIRSYTYDATGNRMSFSTDQVGSSQTYDYQPTSHRLVSVAGVSRTYDPNGNLTTPATTNPASPNFSYGDHNRMTEVSVSGQARSQFKYNYKGERVLKERIIEGGRIYGYVFDESGRLIGEYADQSASVLAEYFWVDDLPVSMVSGGSAFAIEVDHLATPRRVMGLDQSKWSWDVLTDPFGNTPPNEDPDGDGGAMVFNLRFPGQYYDRDTELNYNYMRDYEAITGRYVESDPIGLEGGVSTYSYVEANPLDAIDPFGEQAGRVGGGAARKAAEKMMREYGKRLATCMAAYTAYSRLEGWPPGSGGVCKRCTKDMACDDASANCACWATAVQLRKKYLKLKCDYVMPGSISKGSKNQEQKHRAALYTPSGARKWCCYFAAKRFSEENF